MQQLIQRQLQAPAHTVTSHVNTTTPAIIHRLPPGYTRKGRPITPNMCPRTPCHPHPAQGLGMLQHSSSRLLMLGQRVPAVLSRQARLSTVAKAKQQKGEKGGKKEGGGEYSYQIIPKPLWLPSGM